MPLTSYVAIEINIGKKTPTPIPMKNKPIINGKNVFPEHTIFSSSFILVTPFHQNQYLFLHP